MIEINLKKNDYSLFHLIFQPGERNLKSIFFSRIIFKRRTRVDEEL